MLREFKQLGWLRLRKRQILTVNTKTARWNAPIELSTCAKLLIKLECEKNFLEFSGLRGRNNKKRSQYLFSFMKKHLFSTYKVYGEENKTPNDTKNKE